MLSHIESFLEMMVAERGAAKTPVKAYERDLNEVSEFLKDNYPRKDIKDINVDCYKNYLEHLDQNNISARTQARKLTALKQFYHFLTIIRMIC